MKQVFFLAFLFAPFAAFALSNEFEKATVQFSNGKSLQVEIADSPEKSARGLMFRKSMPENQGMIFIFPDEQPRSFWMKNTFIDLSIGYFDKNRRLVDMQDMQAVVSEMVASPKSYPSKAPAMYAIEVNKGWFAKNNIKLGDSFNLKKKGSSKKGN